MEELYNSSVLSLLSDVKSWLFKFQYFNKNKASEYVCFTCGSLLIALTVTVSSELNR